MWVLEWGPTWINHRLEMAGAGEFLLQHKLHRKRLILSLWRQGEGSAQIRSLVTSPVGYHSSYRRTERLGQQGDWREVFGHHFTSSHERLWEAARLTVQAGCVSPHVLPHAPPYPPQGAKAAGILPQTPSCSQRPCTGPGGHGEVVGR